MLHVHTVRVGAEVVLHALVSATHSFLVMGVTGSSLLSRFFLVKLMDFSRDVIFGHVILGCCDFGHVILSGFDDNPRAGQC